MGRRKKVVEPEADEEILADEEGAETPRGPLKDFHWSDDGPRYNVMIELPDSVPGTRHYGTFLETEDLAIAKHECLARFEDDNKTTLIMDRAEHNREIVRHEAQPTVKDDSHDDTTTAEPVPPRARKSRPLTVKRK